LGLLFGFILEKRRKRIVSTAKDEGGDKDELFGG
jgi:hypothetical protein